MSDNSNLNDEDANLVETNSNASENVTSSINSHKKDAKFNYKTIIKQIYLQHQCNIMLTLNIPLIVISLEVA